MEKQIPSSHMVAITIFKNIVILDDCSTFLKLKIGHEKMRKKNKRNFKLFDKK